MSCPSQSIGLLLTVCPASEASSRPFDNSYCSRRSASVPTVSRRWYVPLAQSALQTLRSHYATHLTVIQFLQRSVRSLAFCWVSGTERCFACLRPGQSWSGLSGCGAIQGHLRRQEVIVTYVTHGHTPTASQILVACQLYNQQRRSVFIQS